jgi:hypothetical protein
MKTSTNLNTPFAKKVIQQAINGMKALEPGQIREAPGICGLDFWTSLSPSEQKRAGTIISAAVDQGLLPLIKYERSPENHLRYTLQ